MILAKIYLILNARKPACIQYLIFTTGQGIDTVITNITHLGNMKTKIG